MQIKIETRISPELISQETFTELDGIRQNIHREVIRLKDEGVRQALIKLGWTPPAENRVQHLPADDSEGGLL